MEKTNIEEFETDEKNKIIFLSINIINFLSEMKNINVWYNKIIQLANDKEKQSISIGFNYLKEELFFIKFCNLMRDYSKFLKPLLNEKESESKKYLDIKKYIESTKFISVFTSEEARRALSLPLHNFNKHEFGEKQYNKSFSEFQNFNNAINLDINLIKKEFEKVIHLYKDCNGVKGYHALLQINDNFSIYLIFDFLLKKNNQ